MNQHHIESSPEYLSMRHQSLRDPNELTRVVVEAGTSETKTETWVVETKTETEAI